MKAIPKTMLVSLLLVAQMAMATDLTGTWTTSVQSQAGKTSSILILVQKGETVNGTYKGELGEAPLSGSVKGNEVTLAFQTEAQGVPIAVTYTATVTEDAMSGKVFVAGFGEGTFSAVRETIH
jgi:hypothetical protein